MANRGQTFGQDFSMRPATTTGANCQTVTAQYTIFCVDSTSADYTGDTPDTLTAAQFPFGVIQNRCDTDTAQFTIRGDGVSAVRCGASIPVGTWVQAGYAASMLGYAVPVLTTATTLLTASVGLRAPVGISLQNGSTLQVIEISIARCLSAYGLV